MALGWTWDPELPWWKVTFVAISWCWWSLHLGRLVIFSTPRYDNG